MKLSELSAQINKLIDEQGDIDVVVIGEDGQNQPKIEFIIEEQEDGDLPVIIICDPWTADQLAAIEEVLIDEDEDDILN
jgi:hypothetical protein